ncbi:heme ABC exporter ATP-binding protein CcmA [Sphingosinithalassobacter tenebrarum]|uniref:Heme ABC exporter ATP-binding protein CcmA n=1 Tax=Stakelama tenebrarum TaxID=2711215 RepID=A0A6G6YAT3_9SPHN|nr:heme ABC exporter ATP-binding protein CcmA [Sphingosinithalassobacter tenebrarum]
MHDLACFRGGRLLFKGVSLALAPGEAAQVTGPNGAGKSSLIRVVAGLLAPAAGRVECEGARALMAESAALDAERPLGAGLRYWAAMDGHGDAVTVALAAVRLADLTDVPVRLLSTGQRRRAALARVVASGAPIWLLDEPANGLDVASVGVLEALIAAHREAGGIALVATHLPVALPGAKVLELGS